MARRKDPLTEGKRYVGNSNKMEVHDLDNEKTGANECQIDDIITAKHAVVFDPDTLDEAHRQGYDNRHHCIGKSIH